MTLAFDEKAVYGFGESDVWSVLSGNTFSLTLMFSGFTEVPKVRFFLKKFFFSNEFWVRLAATFVFMLLYPIVAKPVPPLLWFRCCACLADVIKLCMFGFVFKLFLVPDWGVTTDFWVLRLRLLLNMLLLFVLPGECYLELT